MQKLHLVMGGQVTDPQSLEFSDLSAIDLVGIYDNYRDAREAWQNQARRSVDDAEMKYVVLDLHRLIDPLQAQAESA